MSTCSGRSATCSAQFPGEVKDARLTAAVALLVLTTPFVAEAQPTAKVARIGYLGVASATFGGPSRWAFGEGLRELGWIEGQNLLVEERWAEGDYKRLPALAAELVGRKVDVIVASGAWEPDSTIAGKHLEFLKGTIPGLRRVGVLFDRAEPASGYRAATEHAAVKLGLTLDPVGIETPSEIEQAFALIPRRGDQAVLVHGSVLLFVHRRQIAVLAAKHKIPDIYIAREHVEAGGSMSYGPSIAGLYARAASCVDKILEGANPADLPVEQPARFELVIDLRTAKAIGLTIPPSLLQRADQIID